MTHTAKQQDVQDVPLYRTILDLQGPADHNRLIKLGITILHEDKKQAVVVVDIAQLSTLARLRFRPHRTDVVSFLLTSQPQSNPWLGASLKSLLSQAQALRAPLLAGTTTKEVEDFHKALRALTTTQRAAMTAFSSIDSDGDGLTDTEEQWWCTDPNDAHTRGDVNHTDGDYVNRLVQFVTRPDKGDNRLGQPFQGWPPQTTNFNHPDRLFACPDTDGDSVPDGAERVLGLNLNQPSTTNDRYSDGLKLFKLDKSGATMPPTVLPPGNHPMVAAYPVIHVDAVPGSFRVETVTEIHADTTIITGTAKTYGTSETRGVSDAVANTSTWNNWQEVATTTALGKASRASGTSHSIPSHFNIYRSVKPNNTVTDALVFSGSTVFIIGGLCAAGAFVTAGADLIACAAVFTGLGGFTAAVGTVGGLLTTPAEPAANPGSTQPVACIDPKVPACFNPSGTKSSDSQGAIDADSSAISSQNRNSTLGGTQYQYNPQSNSYSSYQNYPVQYPAPPFVPSTTSTHGSSTGGAKTTTHTDFQENTVSQSQQFSSQTGWTNGWAQNSAHAADLTFSYRISNTGTDKAQSLSDLIFNVYLGDDPNPAFTCQMNNPPPDRNCNLVSLTNIYPGDQHTYITGRIALSLNQMETIDLGGPISVVVDSYSLGADDVFFQNARASGVTVLMDDGTLASDTSLDTYILPESNGDTILDVMGRYFPIQRDANGNVLSISTPKFTTNPPTWTTHPVADNRWFNVYMSNLGNGTTPFSGTLAAPNSALLMRYEVDSDRDGYSDRSELAIMCNGQLPCPAINDPTIHPTPGLTAVMNSTRTGNTVTSRLAFLNGGSYDAYGIQATMYAPDHSISINDNTIGGSGRVNAASQVVLGSQIGGPGLTNWRNSTAVPYTTGAYSGNSNKTFTFTAQATRAVGSTQAIPLNWSDGTSTGTLSIPAGYQSPLPLPVSQGVQVGFYSGSIVAGDSFTATAQLPLDTFSYTVQTDPPSRPGVVINYNDPQGNHSFLSPVDVSDLNTNLAPYANQMLSPFSLSIGTTAPFTASGTNTTNYIFNLPDSRPIVDGHLFVNYIRDDGVVQASQVFTQTLQPGPNILPVAWSTSIFTQTYQTTHDYNILALVTDWQGNIIQSLARPLSSFQTDPSPALAIASTDTAWNFGSVPQGSIVKRNVTFANTGFGQLQAYVSGPTGLTLSATGSRNLVPADSATYTLSLDTSPLPVGGYDQLVTVRTSDPAHPTQMVHVTGTIQTLTDPALSRPIDVRPWDRSIWVSGNHNQNDTVDFPYGITTDPSEVEPLYVYDSGRQTLLGSGSTLPGGLVGGTLPASTFGDGVDGDLNIANGQTVTFCNDARMACAPLANTTAASGETSLSVANADSIFAANQEILIVQVQGMGTGFYDFRTVSYVTPGNVVLTQPLTKQYWAGGANSTEILRVPHFRNLTIAAGGILNVRTWDGNVGGMLPLKVSNNLTIAAGGVIDVSGQGFAGGSGSADTDWGSQGNSYAGSGSRAQTAYFGGGGGGFHETGPGRVDYSGGGGGGHGTVGQNGTNAANPGGSGGNAYGGNDGSTIEFGSGGGQGGGDWAKHYWSNGGNGGGTTYIVARQLTISGSVLANGANGSFSRGGGGGGSGGYIKLEGQLVTLGSGTVSAVGGTGAPAYIGPGAGGNGGNGRIRIEASTLSGTTNPPATTQQVNFFAVQKLNDTTVEYTLPESFTGGRSYWMQFGQHYNYTASGDHIFHVRLPKGRYTNAALDVILGRADANPFNLCLDVGNHGACDWTYSGTPTIPSTQTTSNLATALNTYLASATADPDGTVAVPIRVNLNTGGDIFLTNFGATRTGNSDLTVASTDISFGSTTPMESDMVPVTATVHNPRSEDSGPFTAAFYATPQGGAETYIGSALVQNAVAGGSTPASASIVWNTLGFTGTVNVRVAADPFNRVTEFDETNNSTSIPITMRTRPDLTISHISPSDPEPVVGEAVGVTLTVHNAGQTTAGTQIVALYQGNPDSGGTLIGAPTIPSVPGGGDATVTIPWTVPSTAGPYRLFARADRDKQVNEYNETNNDTWLDLYAGFRGPIQIDSGTASDTAYTATAGYGSIDTGIADITDNCGAAPEQTLRRDPSGHVGYRFDNLEPGHFYHLDVILAECDGAGRQESISVGGNLIDGPENLADRQVHRLSLRIDPALYADRSISVTIDAPGIDGAVVASINLSDVSYRYADAGGPTTTDPQYTGNPVGRQPAFGWVDGVPSTAWGTLPYQSLRVNQSDTTLHYRFDGLDPTRQYQLELTFWQQSGQARPEKVQIDGIDTGTAVDGVNSTQYLKTLTIPPSAYIDGSIVAGIVLMSGATTGAYINEIAVEEVTQAVVNNPVPTLTSLSPSAAVVGGPGFTLTVNGTNFISTSTVQWNGSARATHFVNNTQLTAAITAQDIATAGTFTVTVANPAPGGGPSNGLPFQVGPSNPVPTIKTLNPTSATAGGASFPLTVNGTNFVSGSLVQWNGSARPTQFVGKLKLIATISAADIATAGTATVTVLNPAPGGGTSNGISFPIVASNPVPTLTSISPTSAVPGGASFTLTVNGTNFMSTSTVQWNGSARPTQFGSNTQLTASITAADIATAGTATVTVTNPSPGGGTSNGLPFQVAPPNPIPTIKTLNPASASAGGPSFTLTVNGTNFVNGSIVQWNGSARTTQFVGKLKLTATIPAADIATAGTATVTVLNPTPGGGTSNGVPFQITGGNPVPTITTISPTSRTVGGASFTLTVYGTNFVSTSTVQWNGSARPTTFVSSTKLTAAIPSTDIAVSGTANVTVTNPAPGGGTSNKRTVTIR
ncbi:MAG: hypothetical protein H0X37_22780 [Herpetosiphonaceae bacterium]|nr:hypothetical protein [Herpetosiphonaceae bacterium]